jgi:hypothetical protein
MFVWCFRTCGLVKGREHEKRTERAKRSDLEAELRRTRPTRRVPSIAKQIYSLNENYVNNSFEIQTNRFGRLSPPSQKTIDVNNWQKLRRHLNFIS